jgi:hypothetical protein
MLTNNWQVETSPSKFIYALPAKKKQKFKADELLKRCIYALLFGRDGYEIICPKRQVGGIEYLVVPKLLIPGRPYPVYVYLYGIILYSTNPKMGQRAAAEKTRKRFNLDTFSHTTLGRAMKRLEIRIKSLKNKPQVDEPLPKNSGLFPSVEHTLERKNTIISFIIEAAGLDIHQIQYTLQPQPSHNYKRPPYKGAFFDVCHRVVGYMYIKYRCLLL